MKSSRLILHAGVALFLVLWGAVAIFAQTTTAGKVVGTVNDQTGAVVPKADVQLVNAGTNAAQTTTTDDAGGFVFPVVPPGSYKVTVRMKGFRPFTVSDIAVDVGKTNTISVKLEVGGDTEVVEVSATALAALQTTDAQIGNVLSTDNILRLPTLQRNAVELMNLQPGTVAGGSNIMMRAAGAIDDQNTVTLDGIDITSNLVASNTSIPTPADSVEEFKANVSNANATLMRGSGMQVSLIGRRGSNALHGALYEYLQNTDLNSNTWDNNRIGKPTAAIHDNRFGGRLGGPIQKNKTFFFFNYEGRRFASVAQVTRVVPTPTLKQGIVEFQGPNGLEQFDLKNSAVCGSAGNLACDPRGLGLNPTVGKDWSLMPNPNVPGGDGLNTGGFFANIPTPINQDYGVIRLDHVFNEKLTLNTSVTYWHSDVTGSGDISIENGIAASLVNSPQRTLVPTAQLTWQISPTLLNVVRVGWVRDTGQSNVTSPTKAAAILNLPGSQTSAGPVALLPGSGNGFIDTPLDMNTSRARFQGQWQQDRQLGDDLTKIWGKHQLQAGFSLNELPFTHARADKVFGGTITSLTATIDGDQTYLAIPAANRPVTCSASVSTDCIPSTQTTNWDRYYASVLGLVDQVSVLAVRDSKLQPLPFGTFLYNNTTQWAPYFYVQDSWRIRPSLTLYYGLSYGWQTSPVEQNNLQTLMIYAQSGQEVFGPEFIAAKQKAALAGQIYNPTFGFATLGTAHKPVYNVDYGDVAPRIALAWNPSATSGFLGRLLGQQKTVVRGGFTMVYDRGNTVESVEIPMLGVGFATNVAVAAPLCNATGTGGSKCDPSAGSGNLGLSSFRVATDGTLPLPVATAATSPIIPNPGDELVSFQVDPNEKIGRSYNFDFSIQRELPGNILIEAAYVGRAARRLPEAVNLNSAPYMFVDTASGQSFAQAYDAVANAFRQGQTSAPVQPWFENQFPGLAKAQGTASATAYIANANKSFFTQGNVGQLFLNLDKYRRGLGLQAYDSDQAQVEFMRTYIGYSNYNAGLITITKRMSHGLMVSGNYTFAKALDDGLSNQNSAGFYSNSFNPAVDYGPSSYDRRHVINAYYQYDIPAGKGHWFHGGSVIDQIIGGWYTSGIISAWTGLPLHVTESNQVWGGGTSVVGASDFMIPNGALPNTGVNHNVSATTTCNNAVNPSPAKVGTSLGGATGTNMDIFTDPGAAYCGFSYVPLAAAGRTGAANPMYGLPFWNFDMRFGKTTAIRERWKLGFSADFFNIFNHQNFDNPSLSYTSPATFGVISSTYTPPNRTNAARWIELGLRLDF